MTLGSGVINTLDERVPKQTFPRLMSKLLRIEDRVKISYKKILLQEAMSSLLCASEIKTHNKVLLVVIQSSSKPTVQQKPALIMT